VHSAFCYYATGGNDAFHMPLNSFTAFLDDAAIPDPDSLYVKRSDCDTHFIVANFQPDKNSPDVAVNDGAWVLVQGRRHAAHLQLYLTLVLLARLPAEHALMRFEFLEAIVRLGECPRSTAWPTSNACSEALRLCPALPWMTCSHTLTRSALAKYGKGQSTDDLGVAVELLFERNLQPRLPPQAQVATNDFRTAQLYTEEVRRKVVAGNPCT
jgi:hypothetical protein